MLNLSYVELLFGIGIVLLVLHDIFQGVVVPRWSSRRFRFAPLLIDTLWPVWRHLALKQRDSEAREDFLAVFAPFTLMLMLISWLVMLIVGYGMCFWALRMEVRPIPHTPFEAIYLAGATLLTIGYGDMVTAGTAARLTALAAGASGLAIFALVISLLFTLYGSFERREVLVLQLDARAGNPASGVTLLENYSELQLLDKLPDLFERWEEWSAQVLQSHIAYPMLPFFRSSHEGESWIAALGAVLDAAALLVTSIKPSEQNVISPIGAATLMLRVGKHTVIDLSHWFGFRHDEDLDPQPGVERAEFNAALKRLQKAGFELLPADEAWEKFRVKRSAYAASLNELAKYFGTPPAQWIGDRSTVPLVHRAPHKARRTPTESLGAFFKARPDQN